MFSNYLANLGSVEDIPLGQGITFVLKGKEVAVFRARDGQVFAIENRCPHRQGPLSEGVMGNGKVVCPLHGHKFDLATGRGSEGHECVQVFKVWQQQGQIVIELPWDWINKGKMQDQPEMLQA